VTHGQNGKRIDAEPMFRAEYGAEIQLLHGCVMAYDRRWTLGPTPVTRPRRSGPNSRKTVGR
jgi:hypothetical protein